jgi:hypothetical protein
MKSKPKADALTVLRSWSQGCDTDKSYMEIITSTQTPPLLIINRELARTILTICKRHRTSQSLTSDMIPPI